MYKREELWYRPLLYIKIHVYNFVIIPNNGIIKCISAKLLNRLQCTGNVETVSSSNTVCNCCTIYITVALLDDGHNYWQIHVVVKVRVKWSRYRAGVAQRVGRGIALLFHDRGTRRGWGVSSTPWLQFSPGKDLVPILQVAGWAENLFPTGIRSWTVQPVVSRYTN